MGEYPGQSYKMAAYGSKHYTPVQKKAQWTEAVKSEEKVRKRHHATENAQQRQKEELERRAREGKLPPEKVNVFNSDRPVQTALTYDRIFTVEEGYDQKLKRDDRPHVIHKTDRAPEESQKCVPTLTSSVYGRGVPLEGRSREFTRLEAMKRNFYRIRDMNLDQEQHDIGEINDRAS